MTSSLITPDSNFVCAGRLHGRGDCKGDGTCRGGGEGRGGERGGGEGGGGKRGGEKGDEEGRIREAIPCQ